jgi:hypothetical protein
MMTSDQLEQMDELHDQVVASGACDPAHAGAPRSSTTQATDLVIEGAPDTRPASVVPFNITDWRHAGSRPGFSALTHPSLS